MKIIAAIQILIKLFTIGYGTGAVRTTGRFTAPAAAGRGLVAVSTLLTPGICFESGADQRPATAYIERQRILSTVGAHNVAPISHLYAVSDFFCYHRLCSSTQARYNSVD